jgi:hypothetical protein
MEITLSREEFMCLAATHRANTVIGLDAEALLPKTPAERQAMFDAGEKSLRTRDLLRDAANNEVQLERDLLRMTRTVMAPMQAVVTIKNTAGLGRQLFLHYGRDEAFVEQTLPTERSHRLGDVGNGGALAARLLAIAPVPATAPDASFTLDTGSLVALVNAKNPAEAEAARTAAKASDAALLQRFAQACAGQSYSATIDFLPVIPGAETTAIEVAVIASPQEAWLVLAEDEQTARVSTASATTLGATLNAMIAGLLEVTRVG